MGLKKYRGKFGESYNPREDNFNEQESLPPGPETVPAEKETLPRLNKTGVPEARLQQVGRPKKAPARNRRSLFALVGVVFIAIILGVSTSVWWFTREPAEEPLVQTEVSPLIDTSILLSVPLGSERNRFYEAVSGAISSSGGADIIAIRPTVGNDPASTEQILNTLALSASPSMLRSISEIAIGGRSQQIPFMVMSFDSFDTVFASMFTWETRMRVELSPLFGENTNEFVERIDSRVNNRDVRILIDQNGTDRIVYGFIDKNTLLITTNRNSYSVIAPSIK